MDSSQERPTVSIVIPAYNAAATLEGTLQSLLRQTWKEQQILLVDDGSTDSTVEIARRAAEADSRITVLTQGNLGVSAARNAGLAECTGKYIRFVDADDTLPEDSLERMVLRAEKDRSELVIGGYDQYFGRQRSYHNLAGRDDTVPCDGILDHLCSHANSYFYGVLWNKLFLRAAAEGGKCRFQEDLTWGEDFAFVMDYLSGVNRVSFLNESVYDYRRRTGSTSVRQVLDCVKHPLENIRIKIVLYHHLREMYIRRGKFSEYQNKLWIYLFRVGLG